jgi:hypothetical protein
MDNHHPAISQNLQNKYVKNFFLKITVTWIEQSSAPQLPKRTKAN